MLPVPTAFFLCTSSGASCACLRQDIRFFRIVPADQQEILGMYSIYTIQRLQVSPFCLCFFTGRLIKQYLDRRRVF